MSKIAIIDDDEDIRELLRFTFEKEGYEVKTAENGTTGLELCKDFKPEIAILDVMMPQMDGVALCEELRKIKGLENLLVAFLTARNEDYSQIAGFDAGADDYIAKPIKPKVLVARVNALLRRSIKTETGVEKVNHPTEEFIIDRQRYLVIFQGKEIHLPKKEFELMALLYSKPEMVFERQHILDHVWGSEVVVGDRTIDVHIRKLREKFGETCIQTIKGIGYKFVPIS